MAARKKTAPPAKKRAPTKRRAPRQQTTNTDLRHLLDRRAVSGNIIAAAMFGMTAIITSALIWFQLSTFVAQDDRIARLATAISVVNEAASARLIATEKHLERLDALARDRWRRSNMIQFCLDAERLNKGFVCPSPLEIAPDDPTPADAKALKPDKVSFFIR